MNIHEYQAKQVLKGFGAPVAQGVAITSADEAEAAARQLPGPLYVVKSQIHAGGRGKGKFTELGADAKGGVRLAKSIEEVVAHAKEMLGNTLVTAQTGEAGKQVNRLYIEDGADIDRELYCSLLVDRSTGRVSYVVSTEGGMDIEAVAHDTPEKIITVAIDPEAGVTEADVKTISDAYGLSGWARFRRIVWPTALRLAWPAYTNEAIFLFHATTLVFFSSFPAFRQQGDALYYASYIVDKTFNPFVAYPIAAVYFILLTLCLIGLFGVVNRRLNRHLPGAAKPLRYRPNLFR